MLACSELLFVMANFTANSDMKGKDHRKTEAVLLDANMLRKEPVAQEKIELSGV